MARPCKRRRCQAHDGDRIFKPRSIPMSQLESIQLSLSELDAMRLCDLEGLDQSQAGLRMGVSRGTIQRLLGRGRSKMVEAVLRNRALHIEEGASHEDLYPESRRSRS